MWTEPQDTFLSGILCSTDYHINNGIGHFSPAHQNGLCACPQHPDPNQEFSLVQPEADLATSTHLQDPEKVSFDWPALLDS